MGRYKNVDDFGAKFQLNDALYSEFIAYALKKGLKHEGQNLPESDRKSRVLIKAYVGRNILDNEGFYPVLNTIDPAFKKAVEVVKNHSK